MLTGRRYYYWVKAINNAGVGAASAVAEGYTLLGPRIRVNERGETVTVNAGTEVKLSVSLGAGAYAGVAVDWWLVALTPGGMFYYDAGGGWKQAVPAELPALHPASQGALCNLPERTVFQSRALPPGDYQFYFGVDVMDGVVNEEVVCDSVSLRVAP